MIEVVFQGVMTKRIKSVLVLEDSTEHSAAMSQAFQRVLVAEPVGYYEDGRYVQYLTNITSLRPQDYRELIDLALMVGDFAWASELAHRMGAQGCS